MQSFLFEQPWMVGLAGGLVVAVALFIWIQMAVKQALYGGLVALAVTLALVAMNIQVVTDREEIERILHDVAGRLRANDYEAVYDYIHPNAVPGVMRAKGELPQFKFSDARVTRVRELEVNPDTPPPTAVATFMVVVDVQVASQFDYKGPRLVRVFFMKQGERWLVRDYQHTDPMSKGFDMTDYSDLAVPGR